MYIGTIHSYCQYVLGRIDARYRQFDVLDGNRLKLYLVDKFWTELGAHRFRARFGNRYFTTINKLHDAWLLFNEDLLDVAAIREHDEELGEFIASLYDRLLADHFIDFSLMQRLVVEALEGGDPGAAEAVHELQHLLVDEYQDINPVQDALISLLRARSQTLFVVGDDDQSIYGWRGADVGRIQTFTNRYPGAAQHTLSLNYRSTPLVVRVADGFAHAELGAQRIEKYPGAQETDQPHEFRNLWFDTRDDEATWIVDKIRELLGTGFRESDGTIRGLTPADFAILMRSTRTAEPDGATPRHAPYTDHLQAAGIDFTLEAGGGLFERPHVQALRAAFALLREGQPTRAEVQGFVDNEVRPLFPTVNFGLVARVFTQWGREIHAPVVQGTPRRRVYPQNLVFELLEAFGARDTNLSDATWQDLGVFSRIIQDVEAVFPSVDSTGRFNSILNFLAVVAERGYDTSSSELVTQPDAVTVSTVHKMKGLEFPVVFIADVENQRFPGRRRGYEGLMPPAVIAPALARGSYQSTREEDARLFYTAMTRAERYLYITGCALGPGWARTRGRSSFVGHLTDEEIGTDPAAPSPVGNPTPPARRVDGSNLPTSFSDIKYYFRCPRDYQFRKVYGFSPAVPDLFGFGMTVHAAVGKLHQMHRNEPPTREQADAVADDMFHLKHVQQSGDPENRPGPYERAKTRARELVSDYAEQFGDDFRQRRQVEARFEIPVQQAVVAGAIDLMIEEDTAGNIIDACVIDFKTMEGGEAPEENQNLEWTDLALQVQLYAKAARDVLGNLIEQGHVHLLKDGQRVEVPIDEQAVDAAIGSVEWAVGRVLSNDFPMRPSPAKCAACDFRQICPKIPQQFHVDGAPPAIHVPGGDSRMVPAFSDFEGG